MTSIMRYKARKKMSSTPTMNPALREVWETRARYKVIYGGRASSKSYDASINAVRLASRYTLNFLCIRQFQNSISQSVYTLIKDQIYRFGMQNEFTITQAMITHKVTGSTFKFFGIARNIDEIKSTENIDICWLEEAHSLNAEQWEIINPTIRKEHSEIWLIFNPNHRTDFIWQRFVEHPHKDSIVKKINYTENPFLSKTMLAVIEEAKEEDYEEFEHIYLGKVREGDDMALFTYADIEEAMDGNLDGVDKTGIFSYGVDVARYGNDKGVTTKRRGYQIYDLKEYKNYSTMELANAVGDMIQREEDDKPKAIFVDSIGVGAGVVDRLEEKGYNVIDSNAAMKADNIDTYYNKRAEMYFLLREFIRKGGKIPANDDLKEELLAIRYVYSKANGKIQIQPKDEIKELIGRSPDKSDSLALHFFSEVRIDKSDFVELSRKMFRRKSRRI